MVSFLEAEGAYMEKPQDESQLKSSLKLNNIDAVQHEESTKFESESTKCNDETGGVCDFLSFSTLVRICCPRFVTY